MRVTYYSVAETVAVAVAAAAAVAAKAAAAAAAATTLKLAITVAVAEWVRALDWRRGVPGFESIYGNFASELWQFRLPRFASVFRGTH